MSSARFAAIAVAGALALGASACGSDDESTATPNGSQGGEEQQVRAVIDDMLAAMRERDGAAACALMTKTRQRQVVADVERTGALDYLEEAVGNAGAKCETIYGTLLKAGRVSEDLTPEIRSVKVDGDTAFVTAEVSHDEDRIQRARLVKRGDRWKVDLWFIHVDRRDGA